MRRRRMRTLAFVLAAALGIVWVSPLAGHAAPVVDLSRDCSLTVYATSSDGEFAEDLKEARVVVDLYRVADAVETAAPDGYDYRPDPFYEEMFRSYGEGPEGSLLDEAGKVRADQLDSESWRRLAWRAAEEALGVSPEEADSGNGAGETKEAGVTPGESANTLIQKGIPAGGKAEGLAPGLYLLIARGAEWNDPGHYVRTAGNEEGEKHLVTAAYSEENGYVFEPVLVSVPTKEANEDGVIRSEAPGPWIYDTDVYLKPEQMPYGSLYIIKDLLTYEDSGEASFVFQVDVTLDGRLIDSRVVGMIFTSAGRQELLVDKIPAGATVTVTEVYSGASYTQVGAAPEPVTIRASEAAAVTFTNDYDERKKEGHGIINHFSYEYGEDGVGGWVVEQIFSGGRQEAGENPAE